MLSREGESQEEAFFQGSGLEENLSNQVLGSEVWEQVWEPSPGQPSQVLRPQLLLRLRQKLVLALVAWVELVALVVWVELAFLEALVSQVWCSPGLVRRGSPPKCQVLASPELSRVAVCSLEQVSASPA